MWTNLMSQNMVCVIFYCAIKDDFQLSEELIHSLFFSYFLIFLKSELAAVISQLDLDKP